MNENPGQIIKEMFNSKKSKNTRLMEIINNIPMPEIDIKIGKPLKVDNRIIYPIIKSYVTIGQDFAGIEVFPIALVIHEQENEYVKALMDEEEINPEELLKMVPSKRS